MPFTSQDLTVSIRNFFKIYNREKYIPTEYISHMINSIRARDRKNIQEMQEIQEDYLFRKGAVRLWEYERK